ncbi:MAG: hypothetical protein AAFN70_12445, partial [Planctomycetota bacterium]
MEPSRHNDPVDAGSLHSPADQTPSDQTAPVSLPQISIIPPPVFLSSNSHWPVTDLSIQYGAGNSDPAWHAETLNSEDVDGDDAGTAGRDKANTIASDFAGIVPEAWDSDAWDTDALGTAISTDDLTTRVVDTSSKSRTATRILLDDSFTGSPRPILNSQTREIVIARSAPTSLPDVQLNASHAKPVWPITKSLDQFLAALGHGSPVRIASRDEQLPVGAVQNPSGLQMWKDQTTRQLADLRSALYLSDETSSKSLQQLDSLAKRGLVQAEQLENDELKTQWLRSAHALHRRLQVWRAVHEAGLGEETTTRQSQPVDGKTVVASVDALRKYLKTLDQQRSEVNGATSQENRWTQFLLLDEITAAAKSTSLQLRRMHAQRLLSRLQMPHLTTAQRQWLQNTDQVQQLASELKTWASAPINYVRLLEQLERQEGNSIDLAGIEVATAAQTLRFSDDSQTRDVASRLEAHYRNANLRICMTADMMRRMLPESNCWSDFEEVSSET